jgi:sialate O-acetylesterase
MQYPLGTPTCWNESNINCTVKDAQCGYGCVNNSAAEIEAMANFPMMRLSQNTDGGSKVPLAESGNTGWLTPAKMGGKFSAMCWFFGRDVFKALESPRPIGLIETNVGGTPDQHWSSPDAIDACKGPEKWNWPANFTDSVLWNGKVVPLLRTTIKGAIWMQGEANSRADGRQYNCSFQAMITDWRAKWASHNGETAKDFPFGWAQLNSNGGATTYAAPGPKSADPTDPLGQWSSGFPSIRNAETQTLALPNTFQAVIIDTPVASGSVHSPWKQPAGSRLARGGLAVAYGMDTGRGGPVAVSATLVSGHITVKLGGLGAGGLTLKQNKLGFEALGLDGMWHSTPVTGKTTDSVTVGPAPAGAKAVRYLWYSSPCSPYAGQPQVPYHCPVYTDAKPLGGLTGEGDMLPLGPFVMAL